MRYCFVIPNYNHVEYIEVLLEKLSAFNFPIIMVNDGSTPTITEQLKQLDHTFELLSVIHHQENQGKGGAVQTGIKQAFALGYDYAIQIDADGQHCLDDIHILLELSKQHPDCVVSGKPVYDESVPKHRYLARYITHFWVMVETLSLQLEDTMCGFRVYPLKPCHQLFKQVSLGKRMDFDIEILVRLFWRGVETKFIPTKVIYPPDGISHFKALNDNLRISWLHTRLCFGMLMRLPILIFRKCR